VAVNLYLLAARIRNVFPLTPALSQEERGKVATATEVIN